MMGAQPEAIGVACSRPSRPLRAAFGGGLRPALTGAARAALTFCRTGRRDGPFRSNKGKSSKTPRSRGCEELLGIEVLIVAPHGMQSVQQYAHQRDDRLQPGLAAGVQSIDKS